MHLRVTSVLLAAGVLLTGVGRGATLQPRSNHPPAYVGRAPPVLLTVGRLLVPVDY
jgi:hypothetical protein